MKVTIEQNEKTGIDFPALVEFLWEHMHHKQAKSVKIEIEFEYRDDESGRKFKVD